MKSLREYIDWVRNLIKQEKPAEQEIQVQEKNNAHQITENTTKPKRGRKPKQKV